MSPAGTTCAKWCVSFATNAESAKSRMPRSSSGGRTAAIPSSCEGDIRATRQRIVRRRSRQAASDHLRLQPPVLGTPAPPRAALAALQRLPQVLGAERPRLSALLLRGILVG